MSEAGVEDAASKRILIQNTPKDIDSHRVLIQNSRFLVSLLLQVSAAASASPDSNSGSIQDFSKSFSNVQCPVSEQTFVVIFF
jgi:hypothetical protein